MTIPFTKRYLLLLTASLVSATSLFSQFDNTDFLRAGTVDGLKITEAYITPWVNAFGAGVNGSWYNTAKPHKFGIFTFNADYIWSQYSVVSAGLGISFR